MGRLSGTCLFLCLFILMLHGKTGQQTEVYQLMKKVANWQLDEFEEQVKRGSRYKESHTYWAWTNATLYVGMFDWAMLSKEDKYMHFLISIAEKNAYAPGPDIYHADDLCVSQLYLSMFERNQDSAMIKPTLERIDYILSNRKWGNLDFTVKGNQQRWSWCDALFMAPPVYVHAAKITGNKSYLSFMDEEFKATYDSLYDHKEKLFYRDSRFKTRKEANGKKVFWGRGNGWVIGGLCKMLEHMPADHPDRLWYISIYQDMMKRIVDLQGESGFWYPSMLDPASYPMPETSASSFFAYGIAWGINHGLLSASRYLPALQKAWEALTTAVKEDGMLGWVQPIGFDPKEVTADMTEVYGVGAFLMAGTEYYKMKINK